MKKILAMLIAMLLCVTAVFGLVSCGDNGDDGDTPAPVVVTVQDAIEQIDVLYGRDAKETSENYNLMGTIKVEGAEFNVDWTLTCEDENVTIEKVEVFTKDENGENTETVEYRYYTVTIPHVAKDVTIDYTIKATITKDNETADKEFARTVVHGHVYADATCQVLATCDCGATTGELAACVDEDKNFKCDVCGEVVDHEHVFADATCTAPKTCLCGATEGEKLSCVDEDKNYICDACETSILTGEGTDAAPYVLPYLGSGVCAFPGGWTPTFFTYTATADGYVIVSSDFATAWLMIGKTAESAASNSNGGSGQPIKCLVKAGETVVIGVADWDEKEAAINFSVATEAVEFKDTAFLAGNWCGSETAMWGEQDYVFVINADGTGNGYYIDKTWNQTKNFDITSIFYIGDEIIISTITTGEYGGEISTITFAYAEEEGNKTLTTNEGMMGVQLVLTPFEGEPDFGDDEEEVTPDYATVIVAGSNTLYFSADEVTANTADRAVTITVAGEYKFRAGALWVKSIVDANGNVIAKNDNYNYILEAGEYTVTFGNLSMFGVKADTAQELNLELQAAAEPEEPEVPEVPEEPDTPDVPDTPTTGGSGTSTDPYVIGSLPTEIVYTSKFDHYFSYTTDKDVTIVITYTDGVTINDLPSNAVKDMAAMTWTFTLKAGETVKMNIWTGRSSGDFRANITEGTPVVPEEPEQPGEGGEDGGETTGILVYISEENGGRRVMFEIDKANGTMVVTRTNSSNTFDGTVGTNYTYSYDPVTKTVTFVAEGYTAFTGITFDENGAPTYAAYYGVAYTNYTLQ